MRKGIVLLLILVLLCLGGCAEKKNVLEAEPVVPVATIPKNSELPENILPPDEMPSVPQDGVEVPVEPQPTIITE